MKTTPSAVPRRHFLQLAAGLAGAAAMGSTLAAEAASPPVQSRRALEPLLSELEAQDDKLMLVTRADGMLVHLVARLAKARHILELGTAHGYWTLWLAAAGSARITTIEIKPERLVRARAHIARAGLTKRITFLEGDAHGLVPTLKGPFDLVFLNADKSGLSDYFKKLHPRLLAPGALLLAANAIQRQKDMQGFLATVQQHPDYDTTLLCAAPEDGFFAALRR